MDKVLNPQSEPTSDSNTAENFQNDTPNTAMYSDIEESEYDLKNETLLYTLHNYFRVIIRTFIVILILAAFFFVGFYCRQPKINELTTKIEQLSLESKVENQIISIMQGIDTSDGLNYEELFLLNKNLLLNTLEEDLFNDTSKIAVRSIVKQKLQKALKNEKDPTIQAELNSLINHLDSEMNEIDESIQYNNNFYDIFAQKLNEIDVLAKPVTHKQKYIFQRQN